MINYHREKFIFYSELTFNFKLMSDTFQGTYFCELKLIFTYYTIKKKKKTFNSRTIIFYIFFN